MLCKLSIINELFQCYRLPAIILNKNYSTLYKFNYSHKIDNILNSLPIKDQLKTIDFKPGTLNLTSDNLNFTCICFFNCDNSPLYFIIGPYKFKKETNTSKDTPELFDNINEITKNSLANIVRLYNHILNFDHSRDNTSCYSPLIKGAISFIEKHYSENITIDQICNLYNVNKCYFCNMFKKETGNTFINYLNSYKIEKSKELLKNSSLSLLDISLAVGYNNQSYYSTIFKKFNNISPLEYRSSLIN